MSRDFKTLLEAQWEAGKFLCIGLDPDIEKIPENFRKDGVRQALVSFNRSIFDATKDIVCAFKPNAAFYEMHGDEGVAALRETIQYIREQRPEIPVILDAKRADIGSTNEGYVRAIFDHLTADAVTIQPYLGREAVSPFLARKEKGVFVLCRTSNPGAGEFQDLETDGIPLYQRVARNVADEWNVNGNCGLVVGATYPEEIAKVRTIAPEMVFLIPGTGAQGGELTKSVQNGKDAQGKGFIISSSRSIIYAEDTRKSALEFDGAIRAALS